MVLNHEYVWFFGFQMENWKSKSWPDYHKIIYNLQIFKLRMPFLKFFLIHTNSSTTTVKVTYSASIAKRLMHFYLKFSMKLGYHLKTKCNHRWKFRHRCLQQNRKNIQDLNI